MEKITCSKCGKILHKATADITGTLQQHHILPRCFFKGSGWTVPMCSKCHREIEIIYLRAEKCVRGKRNQLEEFKYYNLYYQYIWGKDYETYLKEVNDE